MPFFTFFFAAFLFSFLLNGKGVLYTRKNLISLLALFFHHVKDLLSIQKVKIINDFLPLPAFNFLSNRGE